LAEAVAAAFDHHRHAVVHDAILPAVALDVVVIHAGLTREGRRLELSNAIRAGRSIQVPAHAPSIRRTSPRSRPWENRAMTPNQWPEIGGGSSHDPPTQ
jgi:hypothetical protein